MLHGFWKLTWLETKIFVREPMGVIATLIMPVVIFVVLGQMIGVGGGPGVAGGSGTPAGPSTAAPPEPPLFNVPILAALLVAVSAVISLVAIISIYREGGILKRLRATPLSPVTILASHVFIKLVFTVVGLALLVVAGRRFIPGAMDVNLASFTAGLLVGTVSILSMGFLIASIVPTARFAQPITAGLLYPMIAMSGLFFPLETLPTALRLAVLGLPTTHAVTLLMGIWDGEGWRLGSVLALAAISGVCLALSTRVFRWE